MKLSKEDEKHNLKILSKSLIWDKFILSEKDSNEVIELAFNAKDLAFDDKIIYLFELVRNFKLIKLSN